MATAICPIRKTPSGGDAACIKERCQWWEAKEKTCSVTSIATGLWYVVGALDDIEKALAADIRRGRS